MQQKEKMRVYALARELDVDSKDLLNYCKELGYDVKNQLSSIDQDQVDKLKERALQGAKGPASTSSAPVVAKPVIQNIDLSNKVRNLPQNRAVRRADSEPNMAPSAETEPQTAEAEFVPEVAATAMSESPNVYPPTAPTTTPLPEMIMPPETALSQPAPTVVPEQVQKTAPTLVTPVPPSPSPIRPTLPMDSGRVRDIRSMGRPRPVEPRSPSAQAPSNAPPGSGGPRPPDGGAGASSPLARRSSRLIRPSGSGGGAMSPSAKPQPTLRERLARQSADKPKEAVIQPMQRFASEDQMKLIGQAQHKADVQKVIHAPQVPVVPGEIVEEDDEDKKNRRHGADAGGIPGRSERHAKRKERAEKRKASMGVTISGGQVEVLDENERVRRRKSQARTKIRQGTMPRTGKVPIDEPITVRALSEAIGWKVGKLTFQLMELGAPKNITINSVIETELAETIALEANVELEVRRAASAEDRLMAAHAEQDNPEEMIARAPIVTIMGHVDHGKTTLLDYIRQSNVVDTEAGGITQVIRAWRVTHDGKPITFIDTPGHEAFTKMRARGAKATDIAVIVVAATDGVMPQTEEAINHAKASDVQLVVCITKTDMPNANVAKTRQQLYSLNILPDSMGGDTPFVETALVKERDSNNWKIARGISELLEQISVAAELRELKANPNKPASGTCLEAHKEGDEGIFATLLVQQGTLRKGDVMLCGGSHGRVRAMYDDLGRVISEAGPSVPVRITGLDEVPDAGDGFHVVPDLTVAREIAEKRRVKRLEMSQNKSSALTLESLSQMKVTELKVILKADFRGSIEAIRAELEKLKHEEVRVRLLHTGIGAITESDVQLALTSPEDTLIVGFNAVPDDQAKALAEARGIKIREYNIIYNLTDDIKKALEGKLKPREEIVHLGRAVVRKTFKISKVGTVAGCFVTQGVIERSARVRVIREGVVIYPPPEKTTGLDSLKRVKDDAKEVAQGYDCGLKITGYDDIKEGDVIEAYRVEQVKRTL